VWEGYSGDPLSDTIDIEIYQVGGGVWVAEVGGWLGLGSGLFEVGLGSCPFLWLRSAASILKLLPSTRNTIPNAKPTPTPTTAPPSRAPTTPQPWLEPASAADLQQQRARSAAARSTLQGGPGADCTTAGAAAHDHHHHHHHDATDHQHHHHQSKAAEEHHHHHHSHDEGEPHIHEAREQVGG